MRIYIPQKITITVKNRLHSRQQPCRSPRQTVIGIGLRKLFYKKFACHRSERLGGSSAASRSAFLSIRFFSEYPFPVRLLRHCAGITFDGILKV